MRPADNDQLAKTLPGNVYSFHPANYRSTNWNGALVEALRGERNHARA